MIQGVSVKSKMVFSTGLFIVLTVIVVSYAFPYFDRANSHLAETLSDTRKEYLEVQAEQRNFELGKRDIKTLATLSTKPDGLFSGDTGLVGEIKMLEELASSLGLELSVTVTGTVATAPKAKTATDIRMIPFSLQLEGTFASIVQFQESLEHARFVSYVKTVTFSPSGKDQVSAIFAGNFFITK